MQENHRQTDLANGTGATGSTGMESSGGRGGGGGASGGSAGPGASSGAGGSRTEGGTSGTLGAGAGGAGEMTGGDSSMDGGQGGAGPSVPDAPTKVDDPDAPGDGPCASKTARDVLDAIHEAYPEFADITDFYDRRYIGVAELVYPYTSDLGFSLVLARGKGDCPGGCSSWWYWYFQTDASCAPAQVGTFSAEVGPGNCYTVKGEPMWGMPAHTPMASDICPR